MGSTRDRTGQKECNCVVWLRCHSLEILHHRIPGLDPEAGLERYPTFHFQPIGTRLRLLYDLCGYGTAIFPFLRHLRKTAWCSCQDPRDNIFSILGLMPEEEKLIGIKPDYTLTKTEVYQDMVLKLLEKTRRLDVFLNCEMRSTTSVLPTCVPD